MPNEKPIPQQIPIEKIHDLPGVIDAKMPEKSYGTLVSSILLNGQKEPAILRPMEKGEYQLVHGYRRRRAAELAKKKDLAALVYDMTEKQAQEYRRAVMIDPNAPIPGKLVEAADKTPVPEKAAKKETEKPAEKKDEAAPPAPSKKPEEKAAESKAPAEKKTEEKKPDKVEAAKAEKPADAPAEKKSAELPKTEKKAEAPKPESAPEAKAADQKEKKAVEAPAPAAADKEKKPAAAKAPAKKAEKEEKPVGTAAVGPTGTSITKLLGEKLAPPTEKDKKALPIPGEGEAFSAVLHPAYLKKADINTFSVDRDSDDFKELFQSIKRFGVKDPVLARFNKDGDLEILSGQRRHLIASELNYPVPTIIQQLDDDDARILVADGNLHREHISSYDLSRALRMKADSMRRKAGRKIRGEKGGPETDELIAKEMGMSTMKLNRLMKLSEATKQICDLVDEGTLGLSIAYNIAFLPAAQQDMVADLIGINVKVSTENTGNLKKYLKTGDGVDRIRAILEGKYPPPKVVEMPKPATPPVPVTPPVPATPSMAPTTVPKSPDISAPTAQTHTAAAQPAAPVSVSAPANTAVPPVPPKAPETEKAASADRENSYETKIVLRGDRLRKYFPDVSMTPREIEDSVYDALEERRQRQEKQKQKAEIFGKEKKGPVK